MTQRPMQPHSADNNLTPNLAPVIVTPGDPAGIGAEIALAAFARGQRGFCLMEDPARLRRLALALGIDVEIAEISHPGEAVNQAGGTLKADSADGLPVLPVLPVDWQVQPVPGRPDASNAHGVITAIERAVKWAQTGDASAVTTNPIHKAVLIEAGFQYPGHTEFLGSLAPPRPGAPTMMLACDDLRVVPVTVHMALADVPGRLKTQDIIDKGMLLAAALSTHFGCPAPRIAVCGLNPHAGEDSQFGDEDARIIAPAVSALCTAGIAATGPHSADSLFHAAARKSYDGVLGMYHDQVLIPIKTLDFDGGVNVTLGLDFVRTSPDHGTAFDIAGGGTARPDSLIAAIRMALDLAGNSAKSQSLSLSQSPPLSVPLPLSPSSDASNSST